MSFMIAFSLASIMLLFGVLLRAKIPFFRNMLVPASVIAGILGLIFMNVCTSAGLNLGTDYGMFNTIVGQLFTVSFISISLTSEPKGEGNTGKNLLENTLQSKITGWTADYLVVCAFMAVSISVIKAWMFPIFSVLILMTIVTLIVTMYIGRRMGGVNDFERTLAMYGMCTGTVPTGIALIRIVDPNFQTTTAVELGACNVVMLASTPVYLLLLGYASGEMSKALVLGSLAGPVVVYAVLLKVTRTWGKPTYNWK